MSATAARTLLSDFGLANPIYAQAMVQVLEVNTETWKATTTLAPLYSAPTGTTKLANPQRLDGDGKWSQPVYVDRAVIIRVSDGQVPAHDTGICGIALAYGGTLLSAAALGDATALPSLPAGYAEIVVGATTYLFPVYPKP